MMLDDQKPSAPLKQRNRWLRALTFALGVLVLLFVAFIAIANTPAFHNWVHRRVVADIEEATGGRVELGALTWKLSQLNFEGRNLVIHGLESPDQAPFVSADRVVVDAKVLSWVGRQVGLRAVTIDHPVIHYIVYPDGHTNQPQPKATQSGPGNSSQSLFDLKLDRVEVRDGLLIVNDRPIPFNFSAKEVQAAMNYVASAQRYDGHASVGAINTAYKNFKSFDSSASAEFSLFPNQVQVKALHLLAGKSVVDASGRVIDFTNPRADLSYTASIDLAQAGEIMLLPQLRHGTMTLKGTGEYTTKNYGTTGNMTLANVEYRDPAFIVPDLDGGADYSADKDNFVLPKIFARVLGGTVTGSAEIKNWSSAPSAPGQKTPVGMAEQVGTIRVKIQNMPVSRVAVAASTRDLPLDRLHAVGNASGTLDVTWRGAPSHARTAFSIDVVPTLGAKAEELPVTATARGVYSADQFGFQQLDLAARSIRLKATGTMARNSNLNVTATVGDLHDIAPLLTAYSPQQQLPAGLEGHGAFTGTLTGRLATNRLVAGHLTLTDIQATLPFHLPAPAATVMKPVTDLVPQPPATTTHIARFDSVAADIRWSSDQLIITNGMIKQGGEQLTLSATVGLVNGRFLETNPIAAKASAKNFQVADLAALAGYMTPMTGVVNGDLDIHGTQDDPRGAAQLQITNGTINNIAFQRASAYVTFLDGRAEFSNVLVSRGSSRVTGDASYNLKTTAFRFNLTGTNFDLAAIPQLQGTRVRTSGTLNFDARGSGTKDAPVVDADVHLRNFTMNGERLGNLDGTAKTTGGVMRVQARSDFPIADFNIDGTVTLRDDFAANLSLKMARLDVDPVLQMFMKDRMTGHSSLSGTMTLAGPLRDPRLLTVTGEFDHFSAEVENVKLANEGPLRFVIRDRILHLEQFKLAGTDTTVTARGDVALTGNRPMDLRADGRINMVLLQTIRPDIHSSGVVDFDMRASGTILHPVLFGNAKITNGAFTDVNFPNGISKVNGTLVFNQDRFQIQELTGTSGGGAVTFGGFVSYGNILTFNVTSNLRDVRVRYPQGLSETLNGELTLTGTRNSSTLSGEITIARFTTSQNFDLALALAAYKQPTTPPDPTSWLNNLRLNLKVTSAPDLQVSSTLAKLSGDVNLNIRGTATRPAVLGRINISEGQVTFNGSTFQLDRGDLSFSNPIKIEPVIDVAATTRIRDYDVTLGFHGPVDRLSTTYRSDPPLPTADIISLLAFGKTREESEMANAAQPTFSESASNAILGQALNSAVSSRVQRLFGVSRIKISPEIGGAQTDPNAQVTIEQQVSKDFTVTYITDITHSSNQQSIQVEYNYSRNLSIIGARDQYGIVSFDVRIRQRKK